MRVVELKDDHRHGHQNRLHQYKIVGNIGCMLAFFFSLHTPWQRVSRLLNGIAASDRGIDEIKIISEKCI